MNETQGWSCREIGMRFHPTRGAMSLGKSKGGLPLDSCCEDEGETLVEMKRLIETFHDNSKYLPCHSFLSWAFSMRFFLKSTTLLVNTLLAHFPPPGVSCLHSLPIQG